MHNSIDLTIAPSEKYHTAVRGYDDMKGPAWDDEHDADDETAHAARSYANTLDNIQDPGRNPEDEALSWGDFSVASDPDLVAKIVTYFDGMYPDEPTDRLRAKLRLLDCEVYANAQIAAQSELRA